MFLHPEAFNPLAAAVEAFVNLPSIDSAAQVEALFGEAVATMGRAGVRLQSGVAVDAYREDQRAVHIWMLRLKSLVPQERRLWKKETSGMRQELSRLLGRLQFATTVEFDASGSALRLYPTVFGVEAACYLVIASAIERDTPIRVSHCAERRCAHFVIGRAGVRGPKRTHCKIHSELRSHR